ncbi:uncharacterized protein LOC135198163 isoform X2 [Macrobrachium nipponense]|uniref:uncharacterized protein LOC135198163 isoform X2 n=1 Tax=Macrobrachium nipponense TaxID=159736 RepID=UPI0030C85194
MGGGRPYSSRKQDRLLAAPETGKSISEAGSSKDLQQPGSQAVFIRIQQDMHMRSVFIVLVLEYWFRLLKHSHLPHLTIYCSLQIRQLTQLFSNGIPFTHQKLSILKRWTTCCLMDANRFPR